MKLVTFSEYVQKRALRMRSGKTLYDHDGDKISIVSSLQIQWVDSNLYPEGLRFRLVSQVRKRKDEGIGSKEQEISTHKTNEKQNKNKQTEKD